MKKSDWSEPLRKRLPKDYFTQMLAFINQVYREDEIYPPEEKVFAALELTSLAATKVIIVGQDPYPQPGKAQGLSFSYPADYKVTRADSISNIQKELSQEGFEKKDSDLRAWAQQGVLLLNAVLTVPKGVSNGHKGKIWEPLTSEIIRIASDDARPKVFLLWGGDARKKAKLVTNPVHLVIETAHPSPITQGFVGSGCFQEANEFLLATGQVPIDWEK
ncbi:MAG: uracil-DNA glycosylase [Streptococcaceae bacterium]|jgi:uracil-DNA glycosylase|nr:uracil-DNA glycosylase [Streptococcaceae bacterium]